MNISDAVKEVIQHRVLILDAMRIGIINFSALSEYLKSDIEHLLGYEVKMLSISMALRRYNASMKEQRVHNIEIDTNTDLMSKSNLIEFTVRKYSNFEKGLKKLRDEVSSQKGEILTTIQGSSNTVILLKRTYADIVRRIFGKEILITKNQLGAIFMGIPSQYREQPGFFYRLTRELAINDINLLSLANIDTEVLFVLHEPDVPRAFQLFYELIRSQ